MFWEQIHLKMKNKCSVPARADPLQATSVTCHPAYGMKDTSLEKLLLTTSASPISSSSKQQGKEWEFLIAFRALISEENILLTLTALCCKYITSNQANLLHVKLKLGGPGDQFRISWLFFFLWTHLIQRNKEEVHSKLARGAPWATQCTWNDHTKSPRAFQCNCIWPLIKKHF